jgi:hypothetical protein
MADKDQTGTTLGKYSATLKEGTQAPSGLDNKITPKKKAILFVPEGLDIKGTDLDIEVVSLDMASFEAMGPRRC